MDPYLEGDLWTVIHSQLGAEIARQLMPKVTPRYVALANRRFVIDTPGEVEVVEASTYPDVGIVEGEPGPFSTLGGPVLTAPLQMETVLPESVPHFWVEIRDTAKRNLVTVIEFLSPTNKRGAGRRDYLEKRSQLLRSTSHLLEIDLLRRGRRVPMQQTLPGVPYFVFLSRAGKRPHTDVWPIGLDHPLPAVPVPLARGDADVELDLQLAFTNVYDVCRCDLLVDYTKAPEIPMPADATAWADQLLRSAGLRAGPRRGRGRGRG
jgi:hypothetical protein